LKETARSLRKAQVFVLIGELSQRATIVQLFDDALVRPLTLLLLLARDLRRLTRPEPIVDLRLISFLIRILPELPELFLKRALEAGFSHSLLFFLVALVLQQPLINSVLVQVAVLAGLVNL